MFMGLEHADLPGLQGSGWGVGQDIKSSVVFKLVNVAAVFIHNPPILNNSRVWISVWLVLLTLFDEQSKSPFDTDVIL